MPACCTPPRGRAAAVYRAPPLLGHVEVRRVEERAVLVVELGPALEDLLRARVDRVVVALDVGVGREVRRRERVRRGGRRVGRRERGRVAGRERRPRELGRVDLVEERVALDRPVPNSNLQLYFNVRVCDGFDASFCWASRTRREQSIRPKISQIDFDVTELENFKSLVGTSQTSG